METIKAAVRQGIPLKSHYYPRKNAIEYEDDFHIFRAQEPVSIFWLIENWCKEDLSINEAKKKALVNAIVQGQQERSDGIPDKLMVGGVRSADEKRRACAKQVEQKSLKEQKPQLALLNKSLGGDNAYQWTSCSLRKLLQWCAFWSRIE